MISNGFAALDQQDPGIEKVFDVPCVETIFDDACRVVVGQIQYRHNTTRANWQFCRHLGTAEWLGDGRVHIPLNTDTTPLSPSRVDAPLKTHSGICILRFSGDLQQSERSLEHLSVLANRQKLENLLISSPPTANKQKLTHCCLNQNTISVRWNLL
jgi:hypothetical protein